jgi:uncharacterized protein (DUF342 family)
LLKEEYTSKIYTCKSLESVLEKASLDLNIPKGNIDYKVIEEKNGFFRSSITIEVKVPKKHKPNVEEPKEKHSNDGSVKIDCGEIIVKNPKEEGEAAFIVPDKNVKLIVDGKIVSGKIPVYEESKIEVEFEKNKATRECNVVTSNNKMEAYLTIKYTPENVYNLKDKNENRVVLLEGEVIEQNCPPKYTLQEIKQELSKMHIVYGIIDKNIQNAIKSDSNNILVAKGENMENGENDKIEIKFAMDKDITMLEEDNEGKIDFKSIGSVEAVKKGEVLAELIKGKEGKDGINIMGEVKKHKPGKSIFIKAGEGCTVEENKVIATIDGKPCMRSNSFYVNQVHEVTGDVEIKTGNIKFIGDIIIHGTVKEGMEVEAGSSINIMKDIERANIKAGGDVDVKGNIIASKIQSGGEDVLKIKAIKDLQDMYDALKKLMAAVEEIKKFNLLGQEKHDGEIIKMLMENKFKKISRLCIKIIADINMVKTFKEDDELVELIREKLMGIAPINIKHYGELEEALTLIEERLAILKGTLSIPVNVKISYCQDSKIFSSGDIIITGKGEYVSNLQSNNSIYFIQDRSLARGGTIKAKKEIKAKVIGSEAGVATTLQVEEKGHIWADIAYQNTVFIIGNRKFILDVPSRNIHAYLNSEGDIIVDRLKL